MSASNTGSTFPVLPRRGVLVGTRLKVRQLRFGGKRLKVRNQNWTVANWNKTRVHNERKYPHVSSSCPIGRPALCPAPSCKYLPPPHPCRLFCLFVLFFFWRIFVSCCVVPLSRVQKFTNNPSPRPTPKCFGPAPTAPVKRRHSKMANGYLCVCVCVCAKIN